MALTAATSWAGLVRSVSRRLRVELADSIIFQRLKSTHSLAFDMEVTARQFAAYHIRPSSHQRLQCGVHRGRERGNRGVESSSSSWGNSETEAAQDAPRWVVAHL